MSPADRPAPDESSVESLSCIADLAISQTPALSGCPDCSSLFGTLSDVARSPSAASACSAMVASLGAMQTAIDGVAAAQAFLNAMICMSSSSASSCGNAIELVADEIADYVCSVDTYDRGPGKPLGCREGYTMRSAGLCMEDCRDGYRYSGSMCKKSCPDGWDTYATSCTQKKPPWKTRDRA
ncbi:hypothetical protein DFJ74DRAFT_683006 [Hyaloraphidium curvatum]|nr:hypothetical protein DFJ74DRAFT_683006 [Hyaloraphidium curvatum]